MPGPEGCSREQCDADEVWAGSSFPGGQRRNTLQSAVDTLSVRKVLSMTKEREKIYMSRKEAAAYTGLSYHFIRKGTENGTIPHIMSGNRFLVNVPRLLQQLEEESVREGS